MSSFSNRAVLAIAVAFGAALACSAPLAAQQPGDPPPGSVTFQVRGAAEKLEMVVNTSRVVEFPFDVPRMLVNNPDLVRVIPISPKSIQLSAVRAGITQVNVWDAEGNVTSIDLTIIGDVQELDATLKSLFPEASIRLRPLNSSLYISGFVPKAEMVNSIIRVAQDYFPQVINDMTVGGVHKVLLHVKVMEVSRTKLRTLGFDWAHISAGGGFITQAASGILETPGNLVGNTGATIRFGIFDGGGQFFGFLEALRQYDLAKLMAEPTLTTLSGRPASFNVGGEIPIPIQQALGVTTVQYRQFGTRIDFVPIVLGNGLVRLEVRPSITEIDPSLRDAVTGIPGFRSRDADTAVEMKAGQTLAIAGLVYDRTEATNRGLPWLADLPWAGVPFRRVSERKNEVELLIFVTPEFCDALDPGEVPPCGPGELTTSPTDCELYFRGYMEVPKGGGGGYGHGQHGPMVEELPPGQPAPLAPPPAASSKRPTAPGYRTAAGLPRRPATGSVSTTRTVSSGGTTASQSGNRSSRKPSTSAQPSLIGPLGYDDLK
jgi:pilus assembly protein CpaC